MRTINDNGEPTKELFIFLKYNKFPTGDSVELLEPDKVIFEDFVVRFKNFLKNFEDGDEDAILDFMSLTTMFGFNRHYCSMTGKPIIGKYFKIGKKIVSKEAYESYRIIREMEKGKSDLDSKDITVKHTNQSFKKHQ
jgi:hypothetical protein